MLRTAPPVFGLGTDPGWKYPDAAAVDFDESWSCKPAFVIEVGFSRQPSDLLEKAGKYFYHSRGAIRTVLAVDIEFWDAQQRKEARISGRYACVGYEIYRYEPVLRCARRNERRDRKYFNVNHYGFQGVSKSDGTACKGSVELRLSDFLSRDTEAELNLPLLLKFGVIGAVGEEIGHTQHDDTNRDSDGRSQFEVDTSSVSIDDMNELVAKLYDEMTSGVLKDRLRNDTGEQDIMDLPITFSHEAFVKIFHRAESRQTSSDEYLASIKTEGGEGRAGQDEVGGSSGTVRTAEPPQKKQRRE
ncbi:hypothetical protein BDV95DRAFT_661440 [Massariosphaeria phaeospora]|uniref:Restriction endonuclease domain-containing protein n=1 Tax=Massariosphaeria phaeospora TaxID=100035 RepID=A0A7C8IEN7_9PLEO|nr:hypothetical protein BDV95DRAFT_661440 [Massariosphaeria phaeospora]